MSSSLTPIIASKPLSACPPSKTSPITPCTSRSTKDDMPSLAASLLTVWVRSIHPSIPPQFSYAARAIAARIPNSQDRKWRLEYRQQTNVYPVVGERKVVNFIVWAWEAEARAEWAAEIMVVLDTSPSPSLVLAKGHQGRDEKAEEKGKGAGDIERNDELKAPEVESVAWRFGPGSGCDDDKVADAWKDWRMIHTTVYYAVDPTSMADKRGGQMTGELIRLELYEGKGLTDMSVLDLLLRGVRKGLGKPYEPKSAELLDRLDRNQKRLEGRDLTSKSVTVNRKFRKTSKGYLPNISIAVYAKKTADQGRTNVDLGDWGMNEPAAVVIIDVWGNGKMKFRV